MIQTPYSRLFVAVAEIREISVDELKTTDVANFLEISVQLLSNWRRRGIPKSKIRKISEKLKVSEFWLENGFEREVPSVTTLTSALDNDFTKLSENESSGLLDKVREKITPVINRIYSSKSSKQQTLEILYLEIELRIQNLRLKAFRTPEIFGLNIERWAKLSFLVISEDGDSAFLSFIPKGSLPTRPDDTDQFIFVHENRLHELESKLSKRFSVAKKANPFAGKEALLRTIQENHIDESVAEFIASLIKNESLKSLQLNELKDLINLLHRIK